MKTVYEIKDIAFKIKIEQSESPRALFKITYGLQCDVGLSYADAAAAVGEALFHALACDGKLNNEGE